jgi:hypothetical protein
LRSREELIAGQISNLLADVRVDAESLGFYLAHSPDPYIYDKIEQVFISTQLNREQRIERIKRMILDRDL